MAAHPSTKADHEDSRKKICYMCGKRSKEIRQLTSSNNEPVKQYVNELFDINDPHFPTGICNTCRIFLNQRAKGESSNPLPVMPNYESITLIRDLRGNKGKVCNCYICITARSHDYCRTPGNGRGK